MLIWQNCFLSVLANTVPFLELKEHFFSCKGSFFRKWLTEIIVCVSNKMSNRFYENCFLSKWSLDIYRAPWSSIEEAFPEWTEGRSAAELERWVGQCVDVVHVGPLLLRDLATDPLWLLLIFFFRATTLFLSPLWAQYSFLLSLLSHHSSQVLFARGWSSTFSSFNTMTTSTDREPAHDLDMRFQHMLYRSRSRSRTTSTSVDRYHPLN